MNNKLLIFARKCTVVLGIALCPVFAMGQQTDAVTLPFAFDGGSADIARIQGMSQNGLGTDLTTTQKLRFDSEGAELVIHFSETAKAIAYTVDDYGLGFGGYYVEQSADGISYNQIPTHQITRPTSGSSRTFSEKINLRTTTRYVRFICVANSQGHMGLGQIRIYNRKFTVGNAGWITYYTEENMLLPGNLKGYIVTNSKENNELVLSEKYDATHIVPAKTPILIKAEPGTYEYFDGGNSTTNVPKNCLHGNLFEGTIAAVADTEYYYKLAQGEYGLGWYWGADGGGTFSMKGFKAYLALPLSAQAPSLDRIEIGYEEETAVENIQANTNAEKFFENGQIYIRKDGAVYTITGVRVR